MSKWDFTIAISFFKIEMEIIDIGSDLKTVMLRPEVLYHSLQLYSKVDVGEMLSAGTITAYLKKKYPKANAERILGVNSEYDYKRKVR